MVTNHGCPRPAPYHYYCLPVPLPGIPEDDWFCPRCAENRDSEFAAAVPAGATGNGNSGAGSKGGSDSSDNSPDSQHRHDGRSGNSGGGGGARASKSWGLLRTDPSSRAGQKRTRSSNGGGVGGGCAEGVLRKGAAAAAVEAGRTAKDGSKIGKVGMEMMRWGFLGRWKVLRCVGVCVAKL